MTESLQIDLLIKIYSPMVVYHYNPMVVNHYNSLIYKHEVYYKQWYNYIDSADSVSRWL